MAQSQATGSAPASFDSNLRGSHTPRMEITVTAEDDVVERAREAFGAIGLTLEQALFAYVFRVAEGTEPIMNEFLPDGTLRWRTLREQTYRMGDFPKIALK
jgi:hypothetical protein